MFRYGAVPLLIALYSGAGVASERVGLENESDKVNYSVGYQIGGDFKRQGVELNPEALVQGIQDALSGSGALLTPEEMRTVLVGLKKKIVSAERQQRVQQEARYRAEGQAFLAANADKEGVVTLPSGLQYKVIREGTGKTPGPNDSVTVRYRGTQIDGTEFDSSDPDGGPETFRVDGVIKGWTEALQLMKEGATWQLFVPADLAYGLRGPLADRSLVFELELISVNPPE
jgi:FKBP-type peptidyl-prolyl cis-trans isomerase FklB